MTITAEVGEPGEPKVTRMRSQPAGGCCVPARARGGLGIEAEVLG